jgi:hypothetical protein
VVVELWWGGGTVAVALGSLLVIVMLVALGVSMWRHAATGVCGAPSPTGSPGVVGP